MLRKVQVPVISTVANLATTFVFCWPDLQGRVLAGALGARAPGPRSRGPRENTLKLLSKPHYHFF